jgi:hypothetical protein
MLNSEPIRTGLVCPEYKRPVAVIENRTPTALVFQWPSCGYRWSAEEPQTQKPVAHYSSGLHSVFQRMC